MTKQDRSVLMGLVQLYRSELSEMGISEMPDIVKDDVMEILKIKSEPDFNWSRKDCMRIIHIFNYMLTSLKIAIMNGQLSKADADIIRERYAALEGEENIDLYQ